MVILIAAIMMYLVMAGAAQKVFYKNRLERCHKCRNDFSRCNFDHATSAFFFGVLWPVAVPYTGGSLIAGYSRDDAAVKRRRREVTEAEHKRDLARIAHDEDRYLTEQLERNGR